jgi:hypothetical protein
VLDRHERRIEHAPAEFREGLDHVGDVQQTALAPVVGRVRVVQERDVWRSARLEGRGQLLNQGVVGHDLEVDVHVVLFPVALVQALDGGIGLLREARLGPDGQLSLAGLR